MIRSMYFMMALALCGTASAAWGPTELQQSAQVALDAFRSSAGQTAYDAIRGFSSDLTSQGDAAKVVVTYLDGGVKKTASFRCHQHDGEVDCH